VAGGDREQERLGVLAAQLRHDADQGHHELRVAGLAHLDERRHRLGVADGAQRADRLHRHLAVAVVEPLDERRTAALGLRSARIRTAVSRTRGSGLERSAMSASSLFVLRVELDGAAPRHLVERQAERLAEGGQALGGVGDREADAAQPAGLEAVHLSRPAQLEHTPPSALALPASSSVSR
jgi:hypothetical protein